MYSYFMVQGVYIGPTSNFPGDDERSQRAIDAHLLATAVLEQLIAACGMLQVHEYGFPDGSCYKIARKESDEAIDSTRAQKWLDDKLEFFKNILEVKNITQVVVNELDRTNEEYSQSKLSDLFQKYA